MALPDSSEQRCTSFSPSSAGQHLTVRIGGTNPALRTFYYRLLRLISHSIHPLFVFDGPNKPPFKRSKRTGPNIASIPEFLAKQLLKQFGLVFHIAPGEAEAECALLQREGIVDAVLSEDVDTLMFGSGVTLRNWSSEGSKSNKTPTHVNLYDAKRTKQGSGLDREGMILIALMSGGDYVPEGIPGCGPKTACEAARAGFGRDLCKIPKKDKVALSVWREKLAYELRTNESKYFKCKHKALTIPEDFPNPDVLGYYTHPCISPLDKVERLRQSLKWDQDLDFRELRTFAADAFDWNKLGGAKKFIRNLAPALLVKELRLRGQDQDKATSEDIKTIQEQEAKLVSSIHGRRNHAATDGVAELRVSFIPHSLVPIDLSTEEPDDEYPEDDSDEESMPVEGDEAPASPSKKRAPSTYDPTKPEKVWIFETYVKVGVPLKSEDWEASLRAKQNALNKRAPKNNAPKTKGKTKMSGGPLNRFTTVTKPGQPAPSGPIRPSLSTSSLTMSIVSTQPLNESGSQGRSMPAAQPVKKLSATSNPKPKAISRSAAQRAVGVSTVQQHATIDLLSSSPPRPSQPPDGPAPRSTSFSYDLPPSVTKRRRSLLKRSKTDTAVVDIYEEIGDSQNPVSALYGFRIPASLSSPPASPSQLVPTKRTRRPEPKTSRSQNPSTPSRRKGQDITDIFLSPSRQADITNYFTPSKIRHADTSRDNITQKPQRRQSPSPTVEALDLTMSPVRAFRASLTPSDLGRGVRIRPRPAENQFSMTTYLTLTHPSPTPKEPARPSQPPEPIPDPPRHHTPPTTTQFLPEEVDLTASSPLKPIALKPKPKSSKPASSRATQSSIRRSPRFKPPPAPIMATPALTAKRKQLIRVRDSLPGAFAIEEVDVTGDTPLNGVGLRRKDEFRLGEVGVLDLTGV
jgi:Holliday junction resolvase YEN1